MDGEHIYFWVKHTVSVACCF